MTVLLIIVGVSALLIGLWKLVAVPVLTRQLFHRRATPLDPETLARCRAIVRAGKGYPYVCKTAVRFAKCPCQPCAKAAGWTTGPTAE